MIGYAYMYIKTFILPSAKSLKEWVSSDPQPSNYTGIHAPRAFSAARKRWAVSHFDM